MKVSKLGIRKWLSFIIAGFIGQIAWAIENNYLNLYVFDCTHNYSFIPVMVALSAAAATITTLLMGALSDRVGKRKIFVAGGYIIWGISIILFAFLDPNSAVTFVANAAMLSGALIVMMDCIMTFFGSTANDAAFNAFVTDNTDETNRGKVESVLSILPLIAMILVVLLQGMLVKKVSENQNDWSLFFYVFGGLTTLAGIACLFLLPKDVKAPNKEEPYLKNIIYGFRPSVVKKNPLLYIVLIAFMIFSIAIQIYMPYFMVYIQKVMEFDLVLSAGSILGTACIITVAVGVFMDKIGKERLIYISLIATIIGAIILFIFNKKTDLAPDIIGGIILMSGFLLATAVFNAKIRDYTPENEVGLFQGVRMIFAVLLPMVSGPYIGQAVSYINGVYYVDDFNQTSIQPNSYIFLFTALGMLFVFIPLFILFKKEKAAKEGNKKLDD